MDRPGPLLAIAALFGGQFIAYQTDKATMISTIADVNNRATSAVHEQDPGSDYAVFQDGSER